MKVELYEGLRNPALIYTMQTPVGHNILILYRQGLGTEFQNDHDTF